MPDTFSTRYAALIAAGKIEADPGQAILAAQLAALARRIDQRRLARKSSSLGWLFAKRQQADPPLQGLYVYGEVGRGKTMLMDLFFAASPVVRKRRAHFHEFMADVHERVHVYRQEIKNGTLPEQDPIWRAAAAIAEETWLLCFDEFHITDIADAMILGRLFTGRSSSASWWWRPRVWRPASYIKTGSIARCSCRSSHCWNGIARSCGAGCAHRFPARKAHRPADLVRAGRREGGYRARRAWRRLAGERAGSPHELVVRGHIVRVPKAAMESPAFHSTISARSRLPRRTISRSRTNSILSCSTAFRSWITPAATKPSASSF